MRPLRLVPDDTNIQFMRGRFAGVIVSAVLSTLSIALFFYPGLNLGVDFRGGILVELRGPQALQTDAIRAAFAPLGVVTTTLAVPAACAPVVAVIEVALTTVTLVAAAPPIVTPVVPVKPVPVIVTVVPPAVGPEVGLIALTVGPAT